MNIPVVRARRNSRVLRTICLLPLLLFAGSSPSAAQRSLIFEDFTAGLGQMTLSPVCGAGSTWTIANTCTGSGSSPSPPNHGRFGVVPGCSSYGSGDVSVNLWTPLVRAQGCRQLTFSFSYLLDFEEGATFDRALVGLDVPGVISGVLYDNGPALGSPTLACSGFSPVGAEGLVSDATWHQHRLDLSALVDSGPMRFLFNGETPDGFANGGQGFLIDDVRLGCSYPGDEFQVNSYTTDGQGGAAVGVGQDGRFVVTWSSYGSFGDDDSYFSVQGRRFDPEGLSQGGDFQINTYTTGSQSYNRVAVADDNSFVVIWASDGGFGSDSTYASGRSIQGQRFDPTGSAIGSQFQINTYTTGSQTQPAIAMNSAGDFVVVWRSDGSFGSDSDDSSVQAQLFEADGSSRGGEFQVNAYTSGPQTYPSVVMDPAGAFVVVWGSNYGGFGDDRSYGSIEAQRFAATGAPVGPQFQVNSYTFDSQFRPSIGMAESGDFVVSWASRYSPGDDDLGAIVARRFQANGTPRGLDFQVNQYTTEFQTGPVVSVATNGTFLVVWESYGSPGNDSSFDSVQAQRFSDAGSPLGSQYQVNFSTDYDQKRPSLGADANRGFVVAWSSFSSFGTDDYFSIQARQLGTIFTDGFESGDTSAWSATSP